MNPTIDATADWPVRVYWEDTDAGGVVYHASYLRFFERARTEWLRDKGLEQRQLQTSGQGVFVVSDMQLKFLRPARLDDLLNIQTRVVDTGRASLSLDQVAWRPTDSVGEPLCQARVRLGWVDPVHMKPSRIPQNLLELITS